MNPYAHFANLKQSVESLKGKRRDDSWEAAQQWKQDAKNTIEEAFDGIECKNALLERACNLFNAAHIAIVGGMPPISLSQEEKEETFQADVRRAIALIGECIAELSKLQQKFGSN